jgi:hypothetical protein
MWRVGQTARPRREYEIQIRIFKCRYRTFTVNELDSVCLNGRAGHGKP